MSSSRRPIFGLLPEEENRGRIIPREGSLEGLADTSRERASDDALAGPKFRTLAYMRAVEKRSGVNRSGVTGVTRSGARVAKAMVARVRGSGSSGNCAERDT